MNLRPKSLPGVMLVVALSGAMLFASGALADSGTRRVIKGSLIGAGVGALVGGDSAVAAGAVVGAIAGAN